MPAPLPAISVREVHVRMSGEPALRQGYAVHPYLMLARRKQRLLVAVYHRAQVVGRSDPHLEVVDGFITGIAGTAQNALTPEAARQGTEVVVRTQRQNLLDPHADRTGLPL